MSRLVRGKLALPNLRVILQRLVRWWQLMKIIRGSANGYLVIGVVVVVMVVMTRGLMMMKLLIVLRSWVTSLRYCGLMEVGGSWRRMRMMMVMVMVILPVSGLLDMVVLMRIHRSYRMLLLIRVRRGRRVIQIGVTQTVLRRDYCRGRAILVENGARRRVEALRWRAGRRARLGC